MDSWIAKVVILVANVALVAIRAPHGHRSRNVKVVKSGRGRVETVLLVMAWLGFFVPLLWIVSPALAFAEYPLRAGPLVAGIACYVWGLWIFYRSHADLGTNWSITLEMRENHRLITSGTYRRIRHPMYLGLLIYSIGQLLVLPNWIAGPTYFVAFVILFAFRVRAEEDMMREHFGDEYSSYMAHTKRLFPGIW